MEIKSKLSGRNIGITIGLAALLIVAFVFVLRAYRQEGEKRTAAISESGEKDPNHVEIFVKLVAVDPIKGDVSARMEFTPHGNLTPDEGATLAQDLKFYVNSATGKQEHVFEKGKRMSPVDATLNLYDGLVTDYPFDQHKAFLELYVEKVAKDKDKDKEKEKAKAAAAAPASTPAATPHPEGEEPEEGEEGQQQPPAQAAQSPKQEEKADEGTVPISVDFYGSIHGFKIQAEKTKESDEDYVGIDMSFSRATTVKFFSVFLMVVMWGIAVVVVLLTLACALRGRKVEVGMFSFLSALIFAFVTVRNAQPGSPPIGSYSDYLSFFWAEILVALCLLTLVSVWVAKPSK